MIKPLKREKIKCVNFKMCASDWATVTKLAKKYTDGNISEWIRKRIVVDQKNIKT